MHEKPHADGHASSTQEKKHRVVKPTPGQTESAGSGDKECGKEEHA